MDADVLAHAVMDAVLGAAALGDIGQHFPDNDPAYAGADSLELARHVARILSEHGYRVENIDATILCQRPKLAPHIPAMRANLAAAFGLLHRAHGPCGGPGNGHGGADHGGGAGCNGH